MFISETFLCVMCYLFSCRDKEKVVRDATAGVQAVTMYVQQCCEECRIMLSKYHLQLKATSEDLSTRTKLSHEQHSKG